MLHNTLVTSSPSSPGYPCAFAGNNTDIAKSSERGLACSAPGEEDEMQLERGLRFETRLCFGHQRCRSTLHPAPCTLLPAPPSLLAGGVSCSVFADGKHGKQRLMFWIRWRRLRLVEGLPRPAFLHRYPLPAAALATFRLLLLLVLLLLLLVVIVVVFDWVVPPTRNWHQGVWCHRVAGKPARQRCHPLFFIWLGVCHQSHTWQKPNQTETETESAHCWEIAGTQCLNGNGCKYTGDRKEGEKRGYGTYVCTPLHVATRMNTHLRPQPKYGESLEPEQRHHLLLHYCSTKWQTGASLAQKSSLSHRVFYNALISSSVPPVVPVRLELYNTYALKAEVSIR